MSLALSRVRRAARRKAGATAPPLRILVTAGPTREKIDPVRCISNYSTGSMGYAVAREASGRGHAVTLISGPSGLSHPRRVRFVPVESARDMRGAVLKVFEKADALIMAAAVCDWRPSKVARRKIKRSAQFPRGRRRLRMELVENPDILREAGRRKGSRIVVGFALETEDLVKNAARKLKEKRLDCIVANRLSAGETVFGGCAADFAMIDRDGRVARYRRTSKPSLARHIIDKVETLCYSSGGE